MSAIWNRVVLSDVNSCTEDLGRRGEGRPDREEERSTIDRGMPPPDPVAVLRGHSSDVQALQFLCTPGGGSLLASG
jgi:hypothetical protein